METQKVENLCALRLALETEVKVTVRKPPGKRRQRARPDIWSRLGAQFAGEIGVSGRSNAEDLVATH